MTNTKTQFILGYSVFLLFIVNMTAMFAAGSITASGAGGIPSPPNCSGDWFGTLTCPLTNLVYFISLSAVDSSYALLNLMLFAPLIIALIWAIIELIRGV